MHRHQQVPWVVIQPLPGGCADVLNERTGARARVCTQIQLHEFAAAAASTPGRVGAGDAVAAVTSRLGIKKCAPCAQRQAALNRMFPGLFKRR